MTGLVKAEFYTEIPGNFVIDFTISEKYPDNPDVTLLFPSLETPQNWGGNYGVRVSGWFLPPQTGDYVFLMASYHDGEFWLSTDDTPAGLLLLMWDPLIGDASGVRDWTGTTGRTASAPENRSNTNPHTFWPPPISLVQGQAYYFEAFMKAGSGRDHLGVTFRLEGEPDPAPGTPSRMTGDVIAALWDPNLVPPVIQTQPLTQPVPFGESVTISVELSQHTAQPVSYQWRLDGVDIPDATEASYTVDSFQPEEVGIYTVFVSNAYGETTSAGAWLHVPVEENLIGMIDGPETRAHTGPRVGTIRFTAEKTFTALTMHANISSGEGTMRMAIYSDDNDFPGTVLGSTPPFSYGPGINSGALTEPVDIVAGQVYWLAVWNDSNPANFVADNSQGARWRLNSWPLSATDPFPDDRPREDWEFHVSTYAIYATDEGGEAPDSTPTGLAGVPTDTSILWSWNAVPETASYEIELHDGSIQDAGGATQFVQEGLSPDTEYQARVRAHNPFGEGPFSAFVQVRTLEEQGLLGMTDASGTRTHSPPSIDIIQFVADTSFHAVIMHARLAANSGSSNLRMAIYADENGEPGSVLGSTVEVNAGPGLNSAPLVEPVEIINGNVYWLAAWNASQLQWVAENDVGIRYRTSATYSATEPFPDGVDAIFTADTTYAMFATGPFELTEEPPAAAPANLAGDPSHDSILWSWNAVPEATGYELELHDGSTQDVGATTQFDQTGLAPETQYQARVRAYNSFGDGPLSDFVQVQTLEEPALPDEGLIGATEGTNTRNQSGDRVDAIRFTAATSFTAETMHAVLDSGTGSGTMRMAIYADNNGVPGEIVGTTPELPFGPGLNSVPLIAPVEIVAGNDYWLAAWNSALLVWVNADGGTRHRLEIAYSPADPFPDGATILFSANTTYAIYATGPLAPQEGLIGMTEGTEGRNQSPPRVDAIQFTAATSFTAQTMHARLAEDSGTGTMRMAIYADDNGIPGMVLGSTAELAFGPGLNSAPLLEPVEILGGNVYWLAAWNDDTIRWLSEDGGVRRRADVTYSATAPFPDGIEWPSTVEVTYAIYATGPLDAPPDGPVLQISLSNGQIVLDWTDTEFRLQSADNIDGPWTDVPDASPPFTVAPVGSQQFYQLAKQQ